MRRNKCWAIGLGLLAVSLSAFAQKDTLNRSVTVERDFQPVIQAAGKISTKPAVIEMLIEPTEVEHSEYKAELTPSATFHPLLSQPTRFTGNKGYNGYVRGAIGHPNTLFDFGYHLDDGKKSILDVYAHHRAEWGLATLSKTTIGLDFTHTYSACDLYFGINGGNVYYHKYGRFYDYSTEHGMWELNRNAYPRPHAFSSKDKTALWTAEAFVGVRSNPKQEVQYVLQTGYKVFSNIGAVNEHQVRTRAAFDWSKDVHHVGAKVYVQNNFIQLGSLAAVIHDSLYNSRHAIRVEPYYAYEGNRVRLHVGVNIDLNIGCGQNALSATKNITFAPSPHIRVEAQIAKQWLTLYADVHGRHGISSLQEFMEENRYRLIHAGIIHHHPAAYTPADGELGLLIRPYRDLLVELHGGYAYMICEDVMVAQTDTAAYQPLGLTSLFKPGDFDFFHTNYQRGKVGGKIDYHKQDIVRIHLDGDYYFWKGDTTVYDRPDWEANLRIDGRINKHWSLYSDNHFAGSRKVLSSDGTTRTEHTLKPVIDLNLGLQYDMWVGKKYTAASRRHADNQVLSPEDKPNLTLFFQLNNWLHRKNEVYYGYRSQGINFLLGATFRF